MGGAGIIRIGQMPIMDGGVRMMPVIGGAGAHDRGGKCPLQGVRCHYRLR